MTMKVWQDSFDKLTGDAVVETFTINVIDCVGTTIVKSGSEPSGTKNYMFTNNFSEVHTFDQTMTWPLDTEGACSVANYRIECTDPTSAVYELINGAIVTSASSSCASLF